MKTGNGTYRTVKQAFDSGAEEFASHCQRYGTIIEDTEWRSGEGYPCRKLIIVLDGCECTIVKCMGVVIQHSYIQQGSN